MFKLEQDEKIVLEVRKHWFIIFVQGFLLFLLAIFPLSLFYTASRLFSKIGAVLDISGDISALLLFFYFLWLLGIWIAFFIAWTDYYLDAWYVTHKRIIDVDQKGLFRREIIDLNFTKIQDATVEISGIIPTLLNFGDIHVQTAGAKREIILKSANKAMEVKRTILLLHEEVMKKDKSDSL